MIAAPKIGRAVSPELVLPWQIESFLLLFIPKETFGQCFDDIIGKLKISKIKMPKNFKRQSQPKSTEILAPCPRLRILLSMNDYFGFVFGLNVYLLKAPIFYTTSVMTKIKISNSMTCKKYRPTL